MTAALPTPRSDDMPSFRLCIRLHRISPKNDIPLQVMRALSGVDSQMSVTLHTTTVSWREDADSPEEARQKGIQRMNSLTGPMRPLVTNC